MCDTRRVVCCCFATFSWFNLSPGFAADRYALLAVVFGALLLSRGAAAQVCIGGEFSCRIYVPNGSPGVELTYELVALKPIKADSLAAVVSERVRHRFQSLIRSRGVSILSDDVARLKQAGLLQPGRQLGRPKLGPLSEFEPFPHAGPVRNGLLKFKTMGGYWQPCLLKLTAGSTVFYMLCNPFGGCSYSTNILWDDDSPEVVGNRWD